MMTIAGANRYRTSYYKPGTVLALSNISSFDLDPGQQELLSPPFHTDKDTDTKVPSNFLTFARVREKEIRFAVRISPPFPFKWHPIA